MRKSAVFILIFTVIVLFYFYSYSGNKASQGKASSNSYPTPFQNNKPSNAVAKPTVTGTSTRVVSPIAVTATPASGNGKMTMSDVSSHNKRNDCYLVIKNNVYDVSSYISNHPGGQGKIISNCGQEVTGIFADIHSNFAWDLLKNYKIGQI